MSKSRRRRNLRPRKIYDPNSRSAPRRFREGMIEAERALQAEDWGEAERVLKKLDEQYPNQPAVLIELLEMYQSIHRVSGIQEVAQRLMAVDPDLPEVPLILGNAYAAMGLLFLALQTYQRFIRRWPQHPEAARIRETVEELKTMLPEMLNDIGLEDTPENRARARQHEEVQASLAQGRYARARHLAQQLIKAQPDFVPAINNLSLAHMSEGNFEQAIETAKRTLTIEPQNIHALSNLVRFLYITGREDEARAYGERLAASDAPAWNKWVKLMEAFTFLQEHQRVLDYFERWQDEGGPGERKATPYHLAAVAAAHLGQREEARRLWLEALAVKPGHTSARGNLEDLDRPVGERHGPWAFGLNDWISSKVYQDLREITDEIPETPEETEDLDIPQRFLRQHPEIRPILPILLERGDPQGRTFAALLARESDDPELLDMLKDYISSPYGPDTLRRETAQALIEQDVISAGPHQMYANGERLDNVTFMAFEIGDEGEKEYPLPPRAEKLLERATKALHEDDTERALRLLQQGIKMAPDSPILRNNLAAAYEMLGDIEKAHELTLEIHEEFPDYFFARANLARFAINEGDLDRAQALIQPLLRRKKLHFSEFNQLAAVQIDFFLAQDQQEGAEQWLEMWASVDPEHPHLAAYQRRVKGPNLLRGLLRRGR